MEFSGLDGIQYNKAVRIASSTQNLFELLAVNISNVKKAHSDYLKELSGSPLYVARIKEFKKTNKSNCM